MCLVQLILILFLNFITASECFCEKYMRVDLTNGEIKPNGIVLNNILYDQNNFFYENHTRWGCICNLKKCIKKCCGPNQKLLNKTCTKTHEYFEFKFYNDTSISKDVKQEDFHILYSKACPTRHVRIKSKSVFLQEDGTLYVLQFGQIYSADKYCIDTFNNGTAAYLCEFYDQQLSAEHQAMIGSGKYMNYYF